MKSLARLAFGVLPERHRVRLLRGLLRSLSGEHRAIGDLFVPPLCGWVPWGSGLGEAMHLLHGLCRAMRPETVVEIGSARGYSTCALALACRQVGRGRVYAIDPHEPNDWTDNGPGRAGENHAFLADRLREYGLTPDWCEVIRARSLDAARSWDRPIDLLFIDGDHSYEGVRGDFEAFRPWLGEDSLVAFHDSMWRGGVSEFLEELRARGYHSVSVNVGPGLTLLSPVAGGVPFLPPGYGRQARGAAAGHAARSVIPEGNPANKRTEAANVVLNLLT